MRLCWKWCKEQKYPFNIFQSYLQQQQITTQNQVPKHPWLDTDQEKIYIYKEQNMQTIKSYLRYFVLQTSAGSYRIILNLTPFSEAVEYQNFKMENLSAARTLKQMMKRRCYMASVDLRQAYYLMTIYPNFTKFLKFKWKGQPCGYTCFENGLANCPRYFTKLAKPLYAQGFLDASFTDDRCLQGQTISKC